jgi:hypothetical protein
MTTSIAKPLSLSRRKKFLFFLAFNILLVLLLLFGAELSLRRKGLRPWTFRPDFISETPGTYIRDHSTLGYLTQPGEFRFIQPGSAFTFKITHLSNGLRITHPLKTYSGKDKKEIWIFGCSFTQGWTLNDEETYPWLLQEKFPDYEVVNFGVAGYSTVQSLLQLREALEKGKRPALVIATYGSFHDMRNTLTRAWIKTLMTFKGLGVSRPYMRLSRDKQLQLFYAPLEYHEVPFAHYSALANYLDETYNQSLESSYHSHETSKAIIEEFYRLCKTNGIDFVVAGIYRDATTTEMLDYCTSKGMMTVDISVDLSIKENTNLPYDSHPSAIANRQYAQKLESFLCGKVINEPLCAKLADRANNKQ